VIVLSRGATTMQAGIGTKAIVQYRVAATSVRHQQLKHDMTLGCSNSVYLWRRAKEQTCGRLAGGHESPQHNEELASQRNDLKCIRRVKYFLRAQGCARAPARWGPRREKLI
jgi:hypothetical protein